MVIFLFIGIGRSTSASALTLALQHFSPRPKLLKLDSPNNIPREFLVHLLNRSSQSFLSSLLGYPSADPLFLIGHKIDALNFYDLKISSQLSFSNKLWNKLQDDPITNILSKLGVYIPEFSQTILGICDIAIQELLNSKVHDTGCSILNGKIKEVKDENGHPMIIMEGGEIIKAKKIFAAKLDPALINYAGIRSKSFIYEQKIMSSMCSLGEELEEAYSRSFPYGFISLLPLAGKRVYVQCCYNDTSDSKLQLDKTSYIEFLNGELQKESENEPLLFSSSLSYPPILLEEVSKRSEKIATWRQANTFYKNNLVLFGDAAHEFYPYLMEDLNINLNEVAMLADMIARKKSLRVYSLWAMGQANVYGNVQHLLKDITQSNGAFIKSIQAAGIGLVNYFPLATYFLNEAAHRLLQSPFILQPSKMMKMLLKESRLHS